MEYQTKLNMNEMAAKQKDIKAAKSRSNSVMQMAPFLQSIGGPSNMGGLAVPGGLASGGGMLGMGGGMTGGEWDASGLVSQMRNANGTAPLPYQIPPPSYPPQQLQPSYSTQMQAMQQQYHQYQQPPSIQYQQPSNNGYPHSNNRCRINFAPSNANYSRPRTPTTPARTPTTSRPPTPTTARPRTPTTTRPPAPTTHARTPTTTRSRTPTTRA